MPGGGEHRQPAAGDRAVHVVTYFQGRDHVVARLDDERGNRHVRQVVPVVREEGDPGEVLCDGGVDAAEACGQAVAQFGAIRISHDDRRHGARPAEVVRIERVEQSLDVDPLESADVGVVVDVPRGRSDEDQLAEARRVTVRREDADHAAHRMPHEDHVVQVEGFEDLQQVLRVPVERVVLAPVVCRDVGVAGADVIEEHDLVVFLEFGRDEAPRLETAAEAVGEDHRATVGVAAHENVVPREDIVGGCRYH